MKATLLIGCWFATALVLSVTGTLDEISSASLLLTGLFVPSIMFMLLLRVSESFRQFVGSLKLEHATLLETPRIIGGAYILMDPKLPEMFALPTGISDITVGITAPLAAQFLLRNGLPKAGFRLWHAFGLFWIVVSVGTGAWSAPASQAISWFPLNLIPTFLGPMVILGHLVALSRTSGIGLLHGKSNTVYKSVASERR